MQQDECPMFILNPFIDKFNKLFINNNSPKLIHRQVILFDAFI